MRQENLHVVIMAGGSGTRFWPASRRHLPKQFLQLTGDQSLLKETYLRSQPIAGAENVWVVTNAAHVDLVRQELPEIPPGNVIGEPVGRNTAPCIALAARCIHERDPAARLLVCPSDHMIGPQEQYARSVAAALSHLERLEDDGEAWTFTLGIKPRFPATGFGYIERGDGLDGDELDSSAPASFLRRELQGKAGG